MDFGPIFDFIKNLSPYAEYILMGLGGLVVLGGVYVKMTPNKKDDAIWGKLENMFILGSLLKTLKAFSPIERKQK